MTRPSGARRLSLLAPLCLALLSPTLARADDASVGVPFPGWRSAPGGSVTASAASVSVDAGFASVTLTVTSSMAGAKLVAALPRFGWLGGQETYPDRQFPELTVSLDGRAVALNSRFVALSGSRDVSDLIRQAALDPYLVAHTPPLLPPASASSEPVQLLKHASAVESTPDGLLAKWTVARTVTVSVPVGTAKLVSRYAGRPVFGLLSTDNGATLASVCMTDQDLARALKHPLTARPYAFRVYASPASLDGYAAPTVSVTVGAADPQEHRRVLTAFCTRDGHASVTAGAQSDTPARADSTGVVHVLSISDEGLAE